MRLSRVLAVLAGGAAVWGAVLLADTGVVAAGAGPAELTAGVPAQISSVSCSRAGNCVAGGNYTDSSGQTQGFVVSRQDGVWGQAIEVPGLAALNTGGDAQVLAMSCAPAGSCVAGGQYSAGGGCVAAERNGRWARATLVPGLAALGGGAVTSVSCASAGNCAAGGIYEGRLIGFRGFVVSQRNGVWGQAIEVPGPLNAGGVSQVLSVSCGAAGNCTAGGFYAASSGQQGFVVSQRDGVWRQAIELPGPGDVSPDGSGTVFAVSCASAGTCTAGGQYTNASGDAEGFVVSRRNGSRRRGMGISRPRTPSGGTSP